MASVAWPTTQKPASVEEKKAGDLGRISVPGQGLQACSTAPEFNNND